MASTVDAATTTSVRNEREIGPGKEVGPGQGICHDSVVIAQAQTIIRDGVGRPAPKKLYTAFLMTLVEPELFVVPEIPLKDKLGNNPRKQPPSYNSLISVPNRELAESLSLSHSNDC
ncbi:hypothetical protein pipiens_019471 [Culex pipiens pipiens]|uniref:Uncharacterized protein n=1 Tax=Culex pipiens pipiens TaxID=38569 RepID=A0ABD1DTY3_CULPP